MQNLKTCDNISLPMSSSKERPSTEERMSRKQFLRLVSVGLGGVIFGGATALAGRELVKEAGEGLREGVEEAVKEKIGEILAEQEVTNKGDASQAEETQIKPSQTKKTPQEAPEPTSTPTETEETAGSGDVHLQSESEKIEGVSEDKEKQREYYFVLLEFLFGGNTFNKEDGIFDHSSFRLEGLRPEELKKLPGIYSGVLNEKHPDIGHMGKALVNSLEEGSPFREWLEALVYSGDKVQEGGGYDWGALKNASEKLTNALGEEYEYPKVLLPSGNEVPLNPKEVAELYLFYLGNLGSLTASPEGVNEEMIRENNFENDSQVENQPPQYFEQSGPPADQPNVARGEEEIRKEEEIKYSKEAVLQSFKKQYEGCPPEQRKKMEAYLQGRLAGGEEKITREEFERLLREFYKKFGEELIKGCDPSQTSPSPPSLPFILKEEERSKEEENQNNPFSLGGLLKGLFGSLFGK